jgi:phosphatidate phosphatase APP1
VSNPGFLLDILQRQQGCGRILIAKMCLVPQFVRQTVVIVVVIDDTVAANVVGSCSQGHRAWDRILVSTPATTRQFEG